MKNSNLTFTWRLDRETRDWLRKEAKKKGRSMNSQLSKIVNREKERIQE